VTGDRLTGGAATVVLCVVAGSALTVGSIRTYALARGHGLDGTAALLVAVSLGGLIAGASLALLHEERGPVGGQTDERRDEKQERRAHDQQGQGRDDIEAALGCFIEGIRRRAA